MKPIPLPVAELKSAFTGLSKIIPRRMTLPILATVKIERTSEGWIALTASDLDSFATVRLEQPTDGEAATVVLPYDELVKISKAAQKNDTISIQGEKKPSDTSGIISYTVGGQAVDHRCTSYDVKEFPEIPRIKGDSVPLPDALRSSIHEAFQCASEDETRYVLQGAYVDVGNDDGHYVVATNGRILYSSNSFKLPLKESVNIPPSKFIGWKEFNNDGPWQLKVGEREVKKNETDPEPPAPYMQLTSRRWRFITRQIDGIYPNWRQVVPDANSWNTRIEFPKDQLDAIIQTMERMPCVEENFTIGLQIEGTKMHLVAKTAGGGSPVKVNVEASVIGKPVTILLNRRFLAQALSFGLNTLHIMDCISPVRLSSDGRQMVIMPIHLKAEAAPSATSQAEESNGEDAISPVNSDAPQPAAQEAAQPHNETMKNNTTESAATTPNGTNGHAPVETKSALELALEQIETSKATVRTLKDGLNTLADTLKQVQREQKSSEKEVQSVRTTLERLQSMKL